MIGEMTTVPLSKKLEAAPLGAILLTLDSSIGSPGMALFQHTVGAPGDWSLLAGAHVKAKTISEDPLQRALDLETRIVAWVGLTLGVRGVAQLRFFAAEYPQIRGAGRSKGDPNQFLPMAAVIGAVARGLGLGADRCHAVFPSEWIGGVPKTTSGDPRESIRGRRVWGLLTAAERERLELQHDAFDAAGMGLYLTGRARRGLAPPRGHLYLDAKSTTVGG